MERKRPDVRSAAAAVSLVGSIVAGGCSGSGALATLPTSVASPEMSAHNAAPAAVDPTHSVELLAPLKATISGSKITLSLVGSANCAGTGTSGDQATSITASSYSVPASDIAFYCTNFPRTTKYAIVAMPWSSSASSTIGYVLAVDKNYVMHTLSFPAATSVLPTGNDFFYLAVCTNC
jgi:hypothetical protein